MSGPNDDVRLPFSVLDQTMGDVLSVLWEPEMMGETGNILRILTSEVLTQLGQQVLQATVLTALMSALQWPIMLTKLGYLIDNPWSNALDRAKQAGAVLADVLIKRHVGLRPVSLIGFSLGARAIFYALMELAKRKAYGIVEEVYLLGATVTASNKVWREVRGVVAGRFVNGFCQKDWILGYLYRATTGGLRTVAGLGPVDYVPDLENVDLTELLVGHMSYRVQMPMLLEKLGFRVTADHFDEPDDMEHDDGAGELTNAQKEVGELEARKRKAFSLFKNSSTPTKGAAAAAAATKPAQAEYNEDEEVEPSQVKEASDPAPTPEATSPPPMSRSAGQSTPPGAGPSEPATLSAPASAPQQQAGTTHDTFDIAAIRAEIARVAADEAEPAPSVGDGNDDLRRKWLGRPAPPPDPSTFVPDDDGGASWDLRPTLPDTAPEDTPPTPVVASVYEDAWGQTDKAWSAPPPRKSSDAGFGRPTISFGEGGAIDDDDEGDMARPHEGWRPRRDTVTSSTWRHDPWNA